MLSALLLAVGLHVPASESLHPFDTEITDPRIRELEGLPEGLRVTHSPDVLPAHTGGRSGQRYTWLYTTTVASLDGDVSIEEFGSFSFEEGEWRFSNDTGKPYTRDDFIEWYSCSDAVVREDAPCSDPLNWSGNDRLIGGRVFWYFIGRDEAGSRVWGGAVIQLLGESVGTLQGA